MAPEVNGTSILVCRRAEKNLSGGSGSRLTDTGVIQRLTGKLTGAKSDKVVLVSLESVVDKGTARSSGLVEIEAFEVGISFSSRHGQIANVGSGARATDRRRHILSNVTPMVKRASVQVGGRRTSLWSTINSGKRPSLEARIWSTLIFAILKQTIFYKTLKTNLSV